MKSPKTRYINLLIAFAMLFFTVFACGSSEEDAAFDLELNTQENTFEEVAIDQESDLTADTVNSAPVVKIGGTWTVMLFQDADDDILEEDIFTDLNEAEKVGSSDKVNLVAQIDRYAGGFTGKQDFSSTKRFYLTRDDDLEIINSEELDDLGEINMADGQSLVDFAVWAINSYPADNYALILSDHGSGWPGGWTDADSQSNSADIQIDGFDDMIYLNEMDEAFSAIIEQTGIDKLDLIGFDACLMGSLEVLAATAPYARYTVLSQETEPSMGWAYSAFLANLVKNPKQDAAELAKDIVKSYIEEDMIITDDAARAAYIEKTYEGSATMSAASLAEEETKIVTLAAIDLGQIPAVMSGLDELSQALSKINQKVVAGSRSHTRAYETVFDEGSPSPFIDLGNFAKMINKESTSERAGEAAQKLITAINKAVIAEKHGPSQKGATGISIYFPNSKLFQEDGSDFKTYTTIANRFANESLWDDYLTFHYTGQEIQAENKPETKPESEPETSMPVTAPGAGEIAIQPIELSGDVASIGSPVTLSTVVEGDNVSYLYIFTGRFTDEKDYLEIVDLDYIDSDTFNEIDGMIYPEWEEGEIPIEMDWEPVMYAVDDGSDIQMVLLEPDTFGAGLEETLYTVDGYYNFASGESRRYASLFFNGDGSLLRVVGFSSEDGTGPQHEITPQTDDTFTIFSQWIPMADQEGEPEYEEAGTLTFGTTPWTWDEYEAEPGDYVIGIIAEDFDGNRYEEYIAVTAE